MAAVPVRALSGSRSPREDQYPTPQAVAAMKITSKTANRRLRSMRSVATRSGMVEGRCMGVFTSVSGFQFLEIGITYCFPTAISATCSWRRDA